MFYFFNFLIWISDESVDINCKNWFEIYFETHSTEEKEKIFEEIKSFACKLEKRFVIILDGIDVRIFKTKAETS